MRHTYLIKRMTATLLTFCLTIGSLGTSASATYGDTLDPDPTVTETTDQSTRDVDAEVTETTDQSTLDIDGEVTETTDQTTRDLDAEVAELLSRGDYAEGRAVVLYDTEKPMSEEQLVGSGSLISSAEQIAEVSAESYVNATGDTLETSEEELVGASPDSIDEDRIAVLAVEDLNRSTEDILRELLADPRVLSAEPDYLLSIDSAESEDTSDELYENNSVVSENDSSDSSEPEDDAIIYGETVLKEGTDTASASEISGPHIEGVIPEDTAGAAVAGAPGDLTSEDTAGAAAVGVPGDLTPEDTVGEAVVGASGDLTPYQWGMSDGSNRYTETVLDNNDVYGVHSPAWNTIGAANSEGVVAVLDTGIDHTHPDLQDSMYVIPDDIRQQLGCGKYGISVQRGVREATDTMDVDGHGTHCAGIIAASWNGMGVSGVASGAKLMAVRTLDDEGRAAYSQVVSAHEFVKKAKESGIDVRAVSNSYSIKATNYAMRTMVEELGRLGIICVYASGNASAYVNPTEEALNHLWDLPNVVIVNASAENGDMTSFSNFSQNETHIFAPGENILSTVPTAGSDEAPRDYFTELDDSPAYTDPSWHNFSSDMMAEVTHDWMTEPYWDYFQITVMTDMSSCGIRPALRFKMLKDIPEGEDFTFCFLIPADKDAAVSYVSADLFTPDAGIDTSLRVMVDEGGESRGIVSHRSDGSHDWVHRSVTGLNDKGRTAEWDEDDCLPVYIDMSKNDDSALKAGDCFYIDNISVGSSAYTNDDTAYGFMSGTSMATPFAAGIAMVLYKDKEVNSENARLLAAGLQGLVRQKDSLAGYCTSGGVLDYSVDSNAMLPVINAASLNADDLTITLDGYFFGTMGAQCSVNLAGEDLEIVSWDDSKVVVKCPAQMASGLQKIILTDAGGLTARGAFSITVPEDSGITDSSAPLYETELPPIPSKVIGADESIINVCGLNDTIYITAGKSYPAGLYAEKLVSYSIGDKKWSVVAEIPFEGITECSMAAFQGAVFLNGTDETGKAHLLFYSPSQKDWFETKGVGVAGASIVNFNNRLLSIGGNDLKEAYLLRELDIRTSPGKSTKLAQFKAGVTSVRTAAVGDTLYVYGGSVYDSSDKKFVPDRYGLACYTITDTTVTEDASKEVEIEPSLASGFKSLENAVCASDKEVYLVGAYLGQDESGSIIDPTGFRYADGDTWALTDQLKNLGKRLSHTIVTFPCATVYKGVLYGFALSTQDGDPTAYIGRATVVDENPDTPVQDTIKVKIPVAKKGLKYNGKTQTGVPASKDGYYTIKNNKKKDPGTYKAQAALVDTDFFMWEDGTADVKNITWSIATVPVTGVKLNKKNLTINQGDVAHLTATVSPSGAYNKAVTWKSADTRIAKVDQKGNVTGVKAGTVKVTVTTKDGGKKAVCTVKVIAGVPVYRLYDIKGNGEHLFTTSALEKNKLILHGWKYEGIGWYEPKKSSGAVYRFYNPHNGYHMYTRSDAERDALVGAGWNLEGIAFYSSRDSNKVPVYRLYNPNSGQHFFTKAQSEKNTLVKAGWKYEGIGFYALKI